MTEHADAHNEVTLISSYKDHLIAVTVPFEDQLPYNKHKYFLFFSFHDYVACQAAYLLLNTRPKIENWLEKTRHEQPPSTKIGD